MLLPSEIDKITEYINRHFVILEDELIGEIADRISRVNKANIVVLNQANILYQMGMLNSEVYKKVVQATNKTEKDIKSIMSSAMITSFKRDNIIFSNEILKDKLKISESLMQTLQADISRLNYDLNNLTGTTAMTTQTAFINAVNQAHLEVISGAKSYTSAMIDAIDKIGTEGVDVLYPSGHKDKVEVATRRAIVTSVNQTNGELQLKRMQELNWDLVEVSAHIGARPTHAVWQGQVYSLSGKNGYKNFYEETEYGTMLGLCGINCRHTFFPFYKGSTFTYNKNELEKINNKKVNFNGKEMSYYQATQYQRYLERTIRKYNRQIEGNSKLLLNNKDIDPDQVKYSIKTIKAKKNGVLGELKELETQVGLKNSNRLYGVGSEVKLYKNITTENIPKIVINPLHKTEKVYKRNEIQEIAEATKELANKYTNNKSKWSGEIVISTRGMNGKLWNCRIEIEQETSTHNLLHEQLHAHSISYYDRDTYLEYKRIEEGTVELYTREICKKENIEITKSEDKFYDMLTTTLYELNNKLKIKDNDFDFAKELFEVPVTERLDYLENFAYNYKMKSTIEEAEKIDKLLEVLYGK